MRKHLRDTTTAKSELSRENLRKREKESNKRKSHKLIRLADRESASIHEALKLSVYQKGGDTDSDKEDITDTSAKDTTTSEDSHSEPTGSQEYYWYDTSNTELTGIQESPVTPSSALIDPDNWSSINRFFHEGCIRSLPIVPIARAALLPVLAPTPLVQNCSFVENTAEQFGSSHRMLYCRYCHAP